MIKANDETTAHFLKDVLLKHRSIDSMIKAKIANIIEEECDNCTIKSVCWNSFSSMVLVGGRCHNKVFLHKGKA